MATYWENSCSFGLRYVSWNKCLIVSLVFSHLGFWSGNLFLIAPFPDLCLLVPFFLMRNIYYVILRLASQIQLYRFLDNIPGHSIISSNYSIVDQLDIFNRIIFFGLKCIRLIVGSLGIIIAPSKCSTSDKVQGAKSAISNLIYGSPVCTDDNHSLTARGLPSRTHGRTIQ